GELLRLVLAREHPDAVTEAHARAAAWHREHGDVEAAIHHGFAAGNLAFAHQLVATHWIELFNRGELATVAGWLASLPDALLDRDPAAAEQFMALVGCLARAKVHERRGDVWAAEAQAARAVELAQRGAGLVERAAALLAHAETLRATGRHERAGETLARA